MDQPERRPQLIIVGGTYTASDEPNEGERPSHEAVGPNSPTLQAFSTLGAGPWFPPIRGRL